MYNFLVHSFSQYNIADLMAMVSIPSFWATIFSLIILEATLSCDNAVVLAIVVKHLPPKAQKHALHWGIVGAYVFRFIAIGLGTALVKLVWVKVIGGAYLLWMAGKFFYGKFFAKDENNDGIPDNIQKGLFATILTVEMMDIAFSADSVLAAFGVSNSVWILLIGGMLGILMMRYAAQLFVALLEKVPELESAAYILIGLIGSKMIAASGGIEVGQWAFVSAMVAIFGGTFVINYLKNKN